MAAPINLDEATTAEGQFLMLAEALVNLQDDTDPTNGANRDGVALFTAATMNDITGFYTIAANLPITTGGGVNGFSAIADQIFYPKT